MSPSKREREYAKRRYDEWQERLARRQEQKRRARRNAIAGVLAVAGVLVVVGAVTLFASNNGNGGKDTAAPTLSGAASAAGTASAAPSGSGSAQPTVAGAAAADNPCPAPSSGAAASPKSWPNPPDPALAEGKTWNLAVETTCGPMAITLDGAKAPKAVASTIFLARNGFWDGTRCHRLTAAGIFVLQCGDPTGTGNGGPGYSYGPVENAPADNVYPAGTVAMARVGDNGTSMGSQFFLVYKDSTIPSDSAGGYTVIGKIVGGLDVVEKVAAGGISKTAPPAPTRAIAITSTTVSPG